MTVNVQQASASDKKRYHEVFAAHIRCPHCGLRMNYVGQEVQNHIETFELATKQYWERVQKSTSPASIGKAVATPGEYKCFFCGVQPLSTAKDTWRLPFGHFSEADKANAEVRAAVLKRDRYTCMDCELRLPRHMEVRHLDEDHSNSSPENLRCVCPFCHMRDHLGPTGFSQAAYVIASSMLSQAQINTAVLICWYILARTSDDEDIRITKVGGDDTQTKLRKAAIYLLNDLYSHGTRWTDGLSKSVTDPFTFGSMLSKLRYEVIETVEPAIKGGKAAQQVKENLQHSNEMTADYKNRNIRFAALSLLPRKEAFEVQIKDWFSYLDKLRPMDLWEGQLNALLKRLDVDSASLMYELIRDWNKTVIAESASNYTPPLPPKGFIQEQAAAARKAEEEPVAKTKGVASVEPMTSAAVIAAAIRAQPEKTGRPDAPQSDQNTGGNAEVATREEKALVGPFKAEQQTPAPSLVEVTTDLSAPANVSDAHEPIPADQEGDAPILPGVVSVQDEATPDLLSVLTMQVSETPALPGVSVMQDETTPDLLSMLAIQDAETPALPSVPLMQDETTPDLLSLIGPETAPLLEASIVAPQTTVAPEPVIELTPASSPANAWATLTAGTTPAPVDDDGDGDGEDTDSASETYVSEDGHSESDDDTGRWNHE